MVQSTTGCKSKSPVSLFQIHINPAQEGFETTFAFKLTDPSSICTVMDDVDTSCQPRGADGLAFVVQTDGIAALGEGGGGLGYSGLKEALAIEFDSFFNPDRLDPYANHVSILLRSSNHSQELAQAFPVVDFATGVVEVKIEYHPEFKEDWLFSDAFMADRRLETLASGWKDGVGMIAVYVGRMDNPLIITPLNLCSTLNLHSGRAWVGFTAATGEAHFQAHDILRWRFSSLREQMNV